MTQEYEVHFDHDEADGRSGTIEDAKRSRSWRLSHLPHSDRREPDYPGRRSDPAVSFRCRRRTERNAASEPAENVRQALDRRPRILRAAVLAASRPRSRFAIVLGRESARVVCQRQGFAGRIADPSERHAKPSRLTAAHELADPARLPACRSTCRRPTRRTVRCHARRYRSALPAAAAEPASPKPSPPPPRPPPHPARKLDADELASLLKRAKGLIAVGDIPPARLLLERAADAQEASAALLLAQTYDPACWERRISRKHQSRSGDGARLVPEGRPARLAGGAAAPRSNAELDLVNQGDIMRR